jgi:hypothetical protein
MKRATLGLAMLLTIAVGALPTGSYGQEDKKPVESYYGVAIGTGGTVGGKSMPFDLRITGYTTDDELLQFAALLKEKGQDALLSALEKEDKGRLNPTGYLGNQIAVARKRQEGADTIITIVTARIMSFRELYNNGRSTSYPFGYMQIRLNAMGEGSGQIMAAAKISFNKKSGEYEIESFGNQYLKAVNLHPSQ